MIFPHRMAAAVVTAALAVMFTTTASAQDASTQAHSLKFVPASAQVYSVMLRGKEQIDQCLKSRAWAKLSELPIVKTAWQKVDEEWKDGQLAQLRTWYEQPENRELVQLLLDAIGEEVFFYGGRNSAEFVQLMQELQGASQFAPLIAAAQGGDIKDAQDPETRLRITLQTLADNPKLLVVPDLVIGFRISDPKVAKTQLKRLEPLIALAAQFEPKLKDALKKTTIAASDYYVLNVEGKSLPWDMIPIRDYEENAGDFDELVKKLKSMTVTIALGLRDDFLLVSVGETTQVLETLGAKPSITSRPELKPVAKFADKKLTGISYASKEWQDKINGVDLGSIADEVIAALKETGLTEEKLKKLKGEINSWTEDLQKLMPIPGAALSVSFMTETGDESFDYDWSKNHGHDSSKPLSILQHLGGAPLFAAAGRTKYAPQEYATLSKVCSSVQRAFEEYGLPLLEQEQQQQYRKLIGKVQPLLQRFDKATAEMLLPSLADGQGAFVIDAKLKSNQWHTALPASKKPIAIIEPAIVFGVSDAELLHKACAEYWKIAEDFIALVAEESPAVREFKLPEPQMKKDKNGTLYFYPLPEILGLDAKLVPTAGLGDKVGVLTISNQHAARLLATVPFKTKTDIKLDMKQPLAEAVYLDWPGFVDAVVPWVEFGLTSAGLGTDEVLSQSRTVAEVLKVLRGVGSITYEEDGVIVTHTRAIIRDLDP